MINIKQNLKLTGVIILAFCTVFVCTIFISYGIDLRDIERIISGEHARAVYESTLVMSNIVVACCGGVLGVVTLAVLLFTIGGYINENRANMGVLKALGYSDVKIALGFVKFGLSVLIGTGLGYVISYLTLPAFYKILGSADMPEVTNKFHFTVLFIMVIIPTALFTIVSVLYALIKLRSSPLSMIKGSKKMKTGRLAKKLQNSIKEKPFLKDLRRMALFNNLPLIFFVGFAAFAFSAMIQMSFSMRKLEGDPMFSAMLTVIGLIIGAVTLLIALGFVINSNKKYLAFMKACGYTDSECNRAMFGGYRIVTYIGFAIGTVYQFLLVKLMASVFTAAYEITPVLNFDFVGFFITVAVFIAAYEAIMLIYRKRIKSIPLKEIMQS